MEREDDIEILFRRIAHNFEDKGEGVNRVFTMLVKVTLKYRDMLVENNEPPLTIGETQQALDLFMLIIKTQKFPETQDPRIKKLITLWLEELPKHIHH
jgi:hypothetical protein